MHFILQLLIVSIMAPGVVVYYRLRARALSHKAMQMWFLLTVLCTIFLASGILHLTDPLRWIGVPRSYVERFNIVIMSLAFRACWALNPQITVKLTFDDDTDKTPPEKRGWAGIPRHGIAVACTHSSFWDVVAFIGVTPLSHLVNTRTLMKDSLRKIPIFGGVFDRVGHFPVYFKSDEDGNFQVDKERQAVVQKDVDRHIGEGGNIGIFPEGAVNKNPSVLQPFRFGTFQTIFEHRMKTYYMVFVGNEKTWPRDSAIGGLPADIRIRVGSYPINFDTESSKDVAQEMQRVMQKVRDEIVAETKA